MDRKQVVENWLHSWTGQKTIWQITGFLCLIVTWGLIGLWLVVVTESWLTPWDTVRTRPPIGTWSRMLNDFFEGGVGAVAPALLVLLASIAIYGLGLSKRQRTTNFTWKFSTVNLIYMLLTVGLSAWARQTSFAGSPQFLPISEIGYHLFLPALLVTAILLIGWFVIQLRISLHQPAPE
jgi:hypothetical protein